MSFKNIRLGQTEDIPALLQLFVRCTDAMLEAGIEQWDYTYPNLESATSDIADGTCHVIIEDGRCLAAITLNEQQDEQYKQIKWAIPAERVLVIHRLAVHPDAQGRGLGKLATLYADQFAKENGYDVIRLDAYVHNPISNHIYRKLGYKLAEGLCHFHEGKPFYCYEKVVV